MVRDGEILTDCHDCMCVGDVSTQKQPVWSGMESGYTLELGLDFKSFLLLLTNMHLKYLRAFIYNHNQKVYTQYKQTVFS